MSEYEARDSLVGASGRGLLTGDDTRAGASGCRRNATSLFDLGRAGDLGTSAEGDKLMPSQPSRALGA